MYAWCEPRRFLFQIGSIRSPPDIASASPVSCFYSRLVRLEVDAIAEMISAMDAFLFQIGSIRRLQG